MDIIYQVGLATRVIPIVKHAIHHRMEIVTVVRMDIIKVETIVILHVLLPIAKDVLEAEVPVVKNVMMDIICLVDVVIHVILLIAKNVQIVQVLVAQNAKMDIIY